MSPMNNSTRIRGTAAIFILLFLICGHLSPSKVVTILPMTYRGVPPVTQNPLPLSADDIVRGLHFNPEISVNDTTLQRAYALRKELNERSANHQRLNVQAQRKTVRLLHLLDEQP